MKTTAKSARRHVRAAALAHYFEVAEAVGLNPQPLLRRANLSRRMLVDLEQRIPLAAAVQLLEESAQASGCADFGLRMAEARRLSDLGALSLLLMHLPTLRAALQTMIRSGQLVSGSLALALVETGKVTTIREEMVVPGIRPSRQAAELALGVLFRLCASLPGVQWNPQSVHFRHPAPPDIQGHRRLFRCRLKFSSEFDGVVCATADLDRPNPLADPVLAAYARRIVDVPGPAEGDSLAQTVLKSLYVQLPLGRASIGQVSEGLGLHARTLQRQLAADGKVFSDLVDEVRRDLVMRYLAQSGHTLTDVAEMMGYSQLSSLTRWFSAQFGMSPTEWLGTTRERGRVPTRHERAGSTARAPRRPPGGPAPGSRRARARSWSTAA